MHPTLALSESDHREPTDLSRLPREGFSPAGMTHFALVGTDSIPPPFFPASRYRDLARLEPTLVGMSENNACNSF